MSAEPVHGTEPANAVPATVYAFRRPRRSSREPRMPTQPPPDLTPEQKLAARLERTFADHGRSLTDQDTALDFTITLGIMLTVLQGMRDQDKMGEEEYQTLHGMVEGMLTAPRLLA